MVENTVKTSIGTLLLFLSSRKFEAKENTYSVTNDEGQEEEYKGIQTNDAPVQYLITQAFHNGEPIDKVICIVSDTVKKSDGFPEFKKFVDQFIKETPNLKEYYEAHGMSYYQIDYHENQKSMDERSSEIYRQLCDKKCLGDILDRESNMKLYIDFSGGMRDIGLLMVVISRYLEYRGIQCKKIVYSNLNDKRIYSIDCMYRMFQLLNGVDQFKRTGSADMLLDFYKDENDEKTKELLKLMDNFSKTMSLCYLQDVDEMMEKINDSLNSYTRSETENNSLFIKLFGGLTTIIREKLCIKEEEELTYPQLIRWCLENNMIQQALTLYIEKMPTFYCTSHILDLSKIEVKNKPGHSPETEAFFTNFIDNIFYHRGNSSEKFCTEQVVNGLEKLQGRINGKNIRFVTETEWGNLEDEMKSEEEKRMIWWVRKNIEEYYERETGELKKGNLGLFPVTPNTPPGSIDKFLNTVLNQLRHNSKNLINTMMAFDDSLPEYDTKEKIKGNTTYKKKVRILSELRDELDKEEGEQIEIPESKVSNKVLYQILKYYCALKVMRNQINHANENALGEDVQEAIRSLRDKHGLNMDVNFENVKEMVQNGLNAHLEQ